MNSLTKILKLLGKGLLISVFDAGRQTGIEWKDVDLEAYGYFLVSPA
jgi:hypothetical protein